MPIHKSANSAPNPARTSQEGQGLCTSCNRGTQPLTGPNRGRTHRGTMAERKNVFSLYCASGTDMRQELCPALFLKIGPRAAQSGSGLPPGSPVIRRRRVRQSRTGALLAPSKGRDIHLSPYLSEHALLHHGLGHPLEAGDVGAGHQVVPQAVFSCRLHAHLVNGVHDLV